MMPLGDKLEYIYLIEKSSNVKYVPAMMVPFSKWNNKNWDEPVIRYYPDGKEPRLCIYTFVVNQQTLLVEKLRMEGNTCKWEGIK